MQVCNSDCVKTKSPGDKYEVLSSVLREIRIEKELTQGELAILLKVPQSFVSKYETGERRLDVIETMEICRALRISFQKFSDQLQRRINKTIATRDAATTEG